MRETELVAKDKRNNGKKKKLDKGSYYHFYYYYYCHHYYEYNYANCASRLTSYNQHHSNIYAYVFVNSAKLYKLIDCCSLLVSLVFWYPTKDTNTSIAALTRSLQSTLLFIFLLLSSQLWTVRKSVNIHNKPIELDKQEGQAIKCCIYDNSKAECWGSSPAPVARCPPALTVVTWGLSVIPSCPSLPLTLLELPALGCKCCCAATVCGGLVERCHFMPSREFSNVFRCVEDNSHSVPTIQSGLQLHSHLCASITHF